MRTTTEVDDIIKAAEAALIDPKKLAELTADAPIEDMPPATDGPARRDWLLKIKARRDGCNPYQAKLGEAIGPFLDAGHSLSMAEAGMRDRLQHQRSTISRFVTQSAQSAVHLERTTPGNIPRGEEVLRKLQVAINDPSIGEALVVLSRLRREGTWQEMADWRFELVIRL